MSEIWQHDRKGVRFLKRVSESAYRAVKHSLAFPQVSSDDIKRFLDLQEELDEFDLVNEFIAWTRELAARPSH